VSDPLADVTVPAPNADPHSLPSIKARARALADVALAFAKGEALTSSPFVNMAAGQLYQIVQSAGRIVDAAASVMDVPTEGAKPERFTRGGAIAYSVPELASHMEPVEVRAVLVYLEAQRKERGERPIYVPMENIILERAPVPAPAAPPTFLAPSPSGIYRVAERKTGVSLPGGVYTINEGADYDVRSVGRDFLESMVKQGVKLKPFPDTAETAGSRATCSACGTSWLMVPYEGRQPFPACPACFALAMIDGERRAAATERERLTAELAEVRAELQATSEAAGAAAYSEARVRALTGWIVDQGAPPPADDGLWHTEGNPASMCPTAPLTFTVKAEFPDGFNPGRVAEALADGLAGADKLASGLAMGVNPDTGLDDPTAPPSTPEGASSPAANTEARPAPAFDTADLETADASPPAKKGGGGNSRKPPRGS
jgi:hypothetical protein